MNKKALIDAILDASKIHHNISTLGLRLPDAPENAPDELFWDTCEFMVQDFIDEWIHNPRNDFGNRNLCGCNWSKSDKYKPSNILANGACKEHDLYHVYQYGRSGATLYWDKYWDGRNSGFYFRYERDELEEMLVPELKVMLDDIQAFNTAVNLSLARLPDELAYQYEQWRERDRENKRRDAMGYNKTLGELLDSDNQAIVRLAKGIKKELVK